MRLFGFAGLAALAACEWGGGADSHGVLGTDAKVKMDAAIDSRGDGGGSTAHVVLNEVMLNSVTGGEFVEIMNPTSQAVDLTHYYLADIGEYWTLPVNPTPVQQNFDFVVQFPAASSLAAGAIATISISSAASFMTAYGSAPTYSLPTMIQTDVGSTPTLTDGGEIIVLFQWDGTSSLVKDVDLLLAGSPTAPNGLVSKSGMMQGTATYATDANTIAVQASAPGLNLSTKRIATEAGHETQAGSGNGITGHDETSEDTSMTWDTAFTAPTPGS